MKTLFITLFISGVLAMPAIAQKKLTDEERAKMTPEQRIVYENSLHNKGGDHKVQSTKKKVKQSKKEDRKSRKLKPPKHKKPKKQKK